jgi:SAM-dependent methyltransferase
MSPYDVDRLADERREADRRYNDALTEIDRIIVGIGSRPLAREDFDQLATALIVFLQHITAYVDTKDRELAGDAGSRIERLEQAFEAIAELRTHVGVLQRSVQGLSRTNPPSLAPPPASYGGTSPPSLAPPPARALPPSLGKPESRGGTSSHDEILYVGFEDQFRGSDDSVHARLTAYVPLFAGASDVLDIGCGRGELLAALKAAGISARGVDMNREMAAVARERGLDAAAGDALGYLEAVADESLGGLIATQVVEHLEPSYLMRLLDTASRKLRPGAPIVLETINAACWLAFFSSYIRDLSHVRPLHPETLQYLLRASGFERVEIRFSAPVPEHMKMKTIDLPADILTSADPSAVALARIAHTVNANAVVLNNLMFTHLDYAAIGYRS